MSKRNHRKAVHRRTRRFARVTRRQIAIACSENEARWRGLILPNYWESLAVDFVVSAAQMAHYYQRKGLL